MKVALTAMMMAALRVGSMADSMVASRVVRMAAWMVVMMANPTAESMADSMVASRVVKLAGPMAVLRVA